MTPLDASDVVRVHYGHFHGPEGHPLAGKRIVVTGFLIRHPRGTFLFDTGLGAARHPGAEARYRPVRRETRAALAAAGARPEDVMVLANCHLHFDHAGGNHLFPRVPIFAQRREREAVEAPDYTIPEEVATFPEARFEIVEGEAEVLPGLRLMPTPGHTDGHQSLVVETRQGRLILAGQAFNGATDYAIEAFSSGVEGAEVPDWVRRFQELDPWRVVFAHDLAVWDRDGSASR